MPLLCSVWVALLTVPVLLPTKYLMHLRPRKRFFFLTIFDVIHILLDMYGVLEMKQYQL